MGSEGKEREGKREERTERKIEEKGRGGKIP